MTIHRSRTILILFAVLALLVPALATSVSAAPTYIDRTNLSFTSNGITSKYHLYADGLDWTRPVGLIVYTDGSGEYGLKNPASDYLLSGADGLVAVAKRQNMVLLTPFAPGAGCSDGDGTCWYLSSSGYSPAQKAKWSADLMKSVLNEYALDRNRVAFGGYSSGAQWTTEYFGPAHASFLVNDGVAIAISYGGRPISTPNFTTSFKQSVPFVWDVGSNDSAYTTTSRYGVRAGHQWYTDQGFETHLNVIQGLGHSRWGQFGLVVEKAIQDHLPALAAAPPAQCS